MNHITREAPSGSAPQPSDLGTLDALAGAITLRMATIPILRGLQDDPPRFAELTGSPAPDGWPEFPEAITFSLAALEAESEPDPLMGMRLFLDASTGRVVGSGGFHGPPDDRGEVEIGYEIAPAYRGRGLGKAAAAALLLAAVDDGRSRVARATTLADPAERSARMLPGLGFSLAEEAEDPDAGRAWVWRRRLPQR